MKCERNTARIISVLVFLCFDTFQEVPSGFWQSDMTPRAQDLTEIVAPNGKVFKWKMMPIHTSAPFPAPSLLLVPCSLSIVAGASALTSSIT